MRIKQLRRTQVSEELRSEKILRKLIKHSFENWKKYGIKNKLKNLRSFISQTKTLPITKKLRILCISKRQRRIEVSENAKGELRSK
jgi:hypothetical protein